MTSLYDRTVPILRAQMQSYRATLESGHASLTQAAPGPDGSAPPAQISDHALVTAKLADDMLPLFVQVQLPIIYFNNLFEQHLGIDPVPLPARTAVPSTADLLACLDATLDRIDRIDRARLDEAEDRPIRATDGDRYCIEMPNTGTFVTNLFIPNNYFHLSALYMILRHRGAPLGKKVYLHPFLTPDLEEAWAKAFPKK